MKEKTNDHFLDLNDLLHPADAFDHPLEVVHDPDLTLNEKRAILSSWASDACALEAAPGLRASPRGKAVPFDDIMDALRSLGASDGQPVKKYHKIIRQRRVFGHPHGVTDSR
jgi:hypothetical protein